MVFQKRQVSNIDSAHMTRILRKETSSLRKSIMCYMLRLIANLVNRITRQRCKGLRELRLLVKNSPRFTAAADHDEQNIKLDHTSQPALSGDIMEIILSEKQEDLTKAQGWVEDMLTYHSNLFPRDYMMRLLHAGVLKDLKGAKKQWSEVESFYMSLTDPNVSDPKQRLHGTVLMAHDLKLADRLDDIRSAARERYNTQQRVAKLDDGMDDIRTKLVEQTRDNKVDHFACAIPIASLTSRSDVHDENEGACPVCQNSYTDLSIDTVADLLADWPVRIKYCGHIIGKGCLEHWMTTPKIDQAKYPHRTCPLCRVKIEGIAPPAAPKGLRAHIKTDRRAIETLRELVYGWDMDVPECLETVTKNMSEEIACEEVLKLIHSLPEKARHGHASDAKMLRDKMEKLKAERWVWGLKGDRVWMQLRDDWMESGVVRKD